MVYADPPMAREILRYSISLQSQRRWRIPYGDGAAVPALQRPRHLRRPRLLAAAGRRRVRARHRATWRSSPSGCRSTTPVGRVSVWEHLKVAFRHQESLRGPHGGYLAGTNGDWSDFSATLPAHDRVDARLRRSSPTPTPGWPRWPTCGATASFAAQLRRRRAGAGRRSCGEPGPAAGTCAATPAPRRSAAGRSSASRSRGRCSPAPRAPSQARVLVAQHPPLPDRHRRAGAASHGPARIGSAIIAGGCVIPA